MYWADTSSYLYKITETYAYVYDQFITNKTFPSLAVNDYLSNLDVDEKNEILNRIDDYIVELENIDFLYNYFESGKVRYIKRRYLNLILSLKDKIKLNISNISI